VYSIFVDEDNTTLKQIDIEDGMWHMHFDGSCSNEVNGSRIILYSHVGKIHNFSKSPTEQLREYNKIAYKDGETIKYFKLHFTKLYNQIPELILPQNQAAFMH
jgi:hypothetical protein